MGPVRPAVLIRFVDICNIGSYPIIDRFCFFFFGHTLCNDFFQNFICFLQSFFRRHVIFRFFFNCNSSGRFCLISGPVNGRVEYIICTFGLSIYFAVVNSYIYVTHTIICDSDRRFVGNRFPDEPGQRRHAVNDGSLLVYDHFYVGFHLCGIASLICQNDNRRYFALFRQVRFFFERAFDIRGILYIFNQFFRF